MTTHMSIYKMSYETGSSDGFISKFNLQIKPLNLWNRSCAFKGRTFVLCLAQYGTGMACDIWHTGIFGMKKWATVFFSYLFYSLLRQFSLRIVPPSHPLLYVICFGLFPSLRILYCHLFSFARDKHLLHLGTVIYRRMNDITYAVLFSRKRYFETLMLPRICPISFPWSILRPAVVPVWCVQWLVLRHGLLPGCFRSVSLTKHELCWEK